MWSWKSFAELTTVTLHCHVKPVRTFRKKVIRFYRMMATTKRFLTSKK